MKNNILVSLGLLSRPARANRFANRLLCLALLCVGPMAGSAATLTITSANDTGAGTFRAAIASAENGDTIEATGISGTIQLLSGELLVSNSVTILGPGPGALEMAASVNRVFHISPGLGSGVRTGPRICDD